MDCFGRFLVEDCRPLRWQIVADMDVLLKRIQRDNAERSTAASSEATQARYWISALSAVSVVLCIGVGIVIVRSLVGQLGGGTETIATASSRIATGDNDLSSRTETRRPRSRR